MTTTDIIRPYLILKGSVRTMCKNEEYFIEQDEEMIKRCFYTLFKGLLDFKYEPKIEVCDMRSYGTLIYVSNMSMERNELKQLLNISKLYLRRQMKTLCYIDCDIIFGNRVNVEDLIKVEGDEERFTLKLFGDNLQGFKKIEV